MPANPDKDPQVTPTAAPAPASRELEPGELTDDDLDKVSGGFAAPQAAVQVPARAIPGGTDALL